MSSAYGAPAEAPRKVLLVNSYAMSLSWAASTTEAIQQTLQNYDPAMELSVEFMDTKQYSSPFYYEYLKKLYTYKYRDNHFDVIIAADDNAAQFILELREQVFSDTPLVFSGINDHTFEQRNDIQNSTGVFEQADMAATIALALRLHPETRTVYVISDTSTTGLASLKQLYRAAIPFQDKVELEVLLDQSMHDLLQRLSTIPEDSIVLPLTFNKDAVGNTFTYEQFIGLVRGVCDRPMYGFWDFYLGRGIVGGLLASGSSQGEAAANLAIEILEGAKADSIPMMRKRPSRYMFDHRELERFGISEDQLPEESTIINKPDNILLRYWKLFAAISTVFILLIGIVFILAFNIMSRRKAERDLERINETLEELVQERTEELNQQSMELEAANIELRRLDEVKTTLMNTVTHDLRTPLTSIIGFAVIIRKDLYKHFGAVCTDQKLSGRFDRICSNLDIITQEGDRLARLINDFLDMSRLEAGKAAWDEASIDPGQLARDSIRAHQGSFLEKQHVQLRMDIAPDLPLILADYDRLRQVLSNLLGNACKFTEKGEVLLSVKQEGNEVVFSVIDSGMGIPQDEQERIFDSFYQVSDNSSEKKLAGSGMGLAICKSVVEHFGGRIWAASNPEGGTIFTFTLPARKE